MWAGVPPLWLPEGSVRALLAFLLVGSAIHVYANDMPGKEFLGTLMIVVVRDYFHARKGEAETP